MRVKSWKTLAAALMMVLGLAFQAEALSITPADAIESGNQTSNSQILTFLAGQGYVLNGVYKDNVGGQEEGPLQGSYDTTYTGDLSGFTIVYTGGPIAAPTVYLLVKDGSNTPAWYFFNLTDLGWNGTDNVVGSGFWPTQGAISHIELFGSTAVPDGGSMAMLLGMALMGLAGARRFMV
jgi:hypothetical protein